MSIENHTAAPGTNIHEEHLCSVAGCKAWGGFGMSTGKNVETRWWCWEHYPHKEPAKR